LQVALPNPVSPIAIDPALGFEREPNKRAFAYWQSRCEGRAMPTRADLDPVAMKTFTPHVGLVEVRRGEAKTAYFIRRAGSRWEDVYGAMTGKVLQEFLPPHLVPAWQDVFDCVTAGAKPIRLTTQVDFQDKTWLDIELMVAPLGAVGIVNMFLTSFVSWSKSTPR
jgi:hypothetical protein